MDGVLVIEKLVFGTLDDHPVGNRRHFMHKRLDGAAT